LEIKGLESSNDYLEKTYDLQEVMKGINLEEMKEVVSMNQNVND